MRTFGQEPRTRSRASARALPRRLRGTRQSRRSLPFRPSVSTNAAPHRLRTTRTSVASAFRIPQRWLRAVFPDPEVGDQDAGLGPCQHSAQRGSFLRAQCDQIARVALRGAGLSSPRVAFSWHHHSRSPMTLASFWEGVSTRVATLADRWRFTREMRILQPVPRGLPSTIRTHLAAPKSGEKRLESTPRGPRRSPPHKSNGHKGNSAKTPTPFILHYDF